MNVGATQAGYKIRRPIERRRHRQGRGSALLYLRTERLVVQRSSLVKDFARLVQAPPLAL